MTSRRDLLLGLTGAAVLAGCTELPQQQDEEPDTEPQETENRSQGEEDQQRNESEEGESQQQADQNEVEEDRIEQIATERAAIEDALRTYVAFLDTEDADILDVTSLSEEFEYLPIVNSMQTVSEDLDREARRESDEELSAEIRTVRKEARTIESIARAQNRGQRAAVTTRNYVNEMGDSTRLTEIHNTFVPRIESFAEAVDTVSSRLERLSSPRINEVSLYEAKLTQFQNELENFRLYAAVHDEYRMGVTSLSRGLSDLENENYSSAEESGRTAVERFERVLGELSGTTDALQPLTDEMVSQVESDMETARALKTITTELSN